MHLWVLPHIANGIEDCAQLCVYVRGKKVIDIWTQHSGYTPSHVQNVFSCTKAISSLVVATLADKGLLSYDQKVTDIWPEYGQHGKQDTTVAMVMQHHRQEYEMWNVKYCPSLVVRYHP